MKVKILKKIDDKARGSWINKHVGKIFEVKDDPCRPNSHWMRADGVSQYFTKDSVNQGVIEIMFEPKSGMVFTTVGGILKGFFLDSGRNDLDVVYLTKDGRLDSVTNRLSWAMSKDAGPHQIKEIFKGSRDYYTALVTWGKSSTSNPGPKVWELKPEVKELTLKEVADKFGIPVEQLRIKDNV